LDLGIVFPISSIIFKYIKREMVGSE